MMSESLLIKGYNLVESIQFMNVGETKNTLKINNNIKHAYNPKSKRIY